MALDANWTMNFAEFLANDSEDAQSIKFIGQFLREEFPQDAITVEKKWHGLTISFRISMKRGTDLTEINGFLFDKDSFGEEYSQDAIVEEVFQGFRESGFLNFLNLYKTAINYINTPQQFENWCINRKLGVID